MTLSLLNDYLKHSQKHISQQTDKYSYFVERLTQDSFREKATDIIEIALLFSNQTEIYNNLFTDKNQIELVQSFREPVTGSKKEYEEKVQAFADFLERVQKGLFSVFNEEAKQFETESEKLLSLRAQYSTFDEKLGKITKWKMFQKTKPEESKTKSEKREKEHQYNLGDNLGEYFFELGHQIENFAKEAQEVQANTVQPTDIKSSKLLLDSFLQKKKQWEDVCFLFRRIFVFGQQIAESLNGSSKKMVKKMTETDIQDLFQEFVVKALPTTDSKVSPKKKPSQGKRHLKIFHELKKKMDQKILDISSSE